MAGLKQSDGVGFLDRVSSFVRWICAAVLCLGVAAHGLSVLLQSPAPELSRFFNPLNAQSHVNEALSVLRGSSLADDHSDLSNRLETVIYFSRGDARLYSLLGEFQRRNGNLEKAEENFHQALRLAPTEIHALSSLLAADIEKQQYEQAVARLDVILRRWPERFDAVWPAMARTLNAQAGAAILLNQLSQQPPWRAAVMRKLLRSGSGVDLAHSVLLDEHERGRIVDPSERDQVIAGLIRHDLITEAYRFFLLTLAREGLPSLAYVYNGDFGRPVDRSPFGWRIDHMSGSDIRQLASPGDQGAGGLRIRFLDSPTKLGNIKQRLVLEPGRYALGVEASGSGLKLPLGLSWSIRCFGTPSLMLSKISLADGEYQNRRFEAGFEVPETGCRSQQLVLNTDRQSRSWNNRYQGEIVLHKIEIVAQEG